MDKQQVRDNGKRRTMLSGALMLAVFAMMIGSVLGAGQSAQGANLGLLGETTYNVIVQTGPFAPLQGVLVEVTTASGGVQTSVITDSTGLAVMHVPDTFAGVTTPYKTAYEFTPVNANVSFPNLSMTDIVFTAATSTRLINVSGSITAPGLLTAGVLGVTVTIAGDGVPTTQTLTDGAGAYTIDLPVNATNVTLTPALAGYTFEPASAALRPLGAPQSQNFAATPSFVTLIAISGNVTGMSTATVVTLTATGSETTSTQITGPGAYSLSVSSGFTGVVTPSAAGLTFTPASRSYTSITVNQTAQDYVASAGPKPSVFKKIEGNVRGVTGTTVTITVTDTTGTALLTVITTGTYSVSVATPFSGYVKANAEGYNFLPFRRAYENLMVDLLLNVKPQDFDAVPLSKTGLTDVYDIVYKPNGKGKAALLDGTAGIKISSGSIIITGASDSDTLSIKVNKATKKNPTALAALPAIASIQTSQGLKILLTEARVDTLSAKGVLGKITSTNASIGKIVTAGGIGAIAMTDNKPSPTEVITAIVAAGTNTKKASVKLMGIKLEVLVTPETQAFTLVQLETKKSKVVGSRPAQFIVAESGFLGGAGS
ncbi:MAG: hypothetical protein NTX50_04925, partial [Candidatus Sumerlaeota bacterium]|nr:hypothetical protein [Candidatus Sumerlaeota bacterium]